MAAVNSLARKRGGAGPRGSAGKRLYAIGDVHGRLDLLIPLIEAIEADNAARPARETHLVMLGDLIDRGPDSRGVIEFLLQRPPKFARVHCLMGNHEEALTQGLAGRRDLLEKWLSCGGIACAQSYGAPVGRLIGATPEVIEHVLLQHIPPSHLKFMAGFLDRITFGDYLLVHAGVRPGVPLERQGRDLRWIREEFLTSKDDHGYVVIHGHTISADIDERANRIGIDTGAYRTDILTAVRIEDAERSYLQTGMAARNAA